MPPIGPRLRNYIELMGTGVGDMIERCRNAGLLEPEFYLTDGFVTIIRRRPELALKAVSGQSTPQVTPQVTPPVEVLLRLLDSCDALSNMEIRKGLGLKDRKHVGERYLDPALVEGLVELTIQDKPRSSLQKYRLTEKGVRRGKGDLHQLEGVDLAMSLAGVLLFAERPEWILALIHRQSHSLPRQCHSFHRVSGYRGFFRVATQDL
jgi:hypothetical protein